MSAHVLDLKRGETRQEEYALVKFRDANIYGLTVALIFDLLASCYSDTGDSFSDFLSKAAVRPNVKKIHSIEKPSSLT